MSCMLSLWLAAVDASVGVPIVRMPNGRAGMAHRPAFGNFCR